MYIGIAPLRISFAGGGTDQPEFYEKFGGNVICTTINRFTYVTIHKRFDKSFQTFSPDFQKHYKPTEFKKIEIEDGSEIAASIVKFLKFKVGVDIVLQSDVPAGSGLGASSSLAINLVNTLNYLQGKNWSKTKIAEMCFGIERNVLKWPMGKQDEYITSFGGFKNIEFKKNKVNIKPVTISKKLSLELQNNLLLFFVGQTRDSAKLLSSQLKRVKNENKKTIKSLQVVKSLALELNDTLQKSDLTRFGELLHKGWIAKKEFTIGITNKRIDKIYESALKFGASGGKLTGAGGGGHLLLYCEKSRQKKLIDKMKKMSLTHVDFKFYNEGPKILDLYKELNK